MSEKVDQVKLDYAVSYIRQHIAELRTATQAKQQMVLAGGSFGYLATDETRLYRKSAEMLEQLLERKVRA